MLIQGVCLRLEIEALVDYAKSSDNYKRNDVDKPETYIATTNNFTARQRNGANCTGDSICDISFWTISLWTGTPC